MDYNNMRYNVINGNGYEKKDRKKVFVRNE